jgi:regulator of protease activity HflC (stomatin/prohibitin superfamily)
MKLRNFLGFFVINPQQEAKLIERFGKYHRTLKPGVNFKIPFVDKIAYRHNLKEQIISIERQTAITRDNVKINIDGVLYFKINDPYKASYAVKDPIGAMSLLAQTSMRSEIGKLELDSTFEERESLNQMIKKSLNEASDKWGIDCMRYEIKDIQPPDRIKRSMEMQAESERMKRSRILASEGEMRSKINIAEGVRRELILEGDGEAQRILQENLAQVETIKQISEVIKNHQDQKGDLPIPSINLSLTNQYLQALREIYKKS